MEPFKQAMEGMPAILITKGTLLIFATFIIIIMAIFVARYSIAFHRCQMIKPSPFMARNKESGNPLVLMQKLKVLAFLALFISLSLGACKSAVPVQNDKYVDLYLRDSIPYSLARHEIPSEQLLIFLAPALDTVSFEETDLYAGIFEAGYDILCIYQPKAVGGYYYSRKAMEFKGQQIQNAQNLITYLRKQKLIPKAEHTVLMGMDQGAYMTPLLMANNHIDTAIFINANPFSVYMSLQRIADGRMEWNDQRQDFIKRKFGLDSLHVFKEKVAEVETVGSELYSLGNFTNMYWLSYHANFMLEEYRQTPGHSYWIFFKDYPLYKSSDFEYLKLLDKTRANASAEYQVLEGYNYMSEENWEALESVLLPFFNKD